MHRFDVFGQRIGVVREEGRWHAVFIGDAGKHREARGVTVCPYCPFVRAFIEEHTGYLDLVPVEARGRFGLS